VWYHRYSAVPCSKCRCKCDSGVDGKDRWNIVLWIVTVCVIVASVMSLCECVPLLLCLWVPSIFTLSKVVCSVHFFRSVYSVSCINYMHGINYITSIKSVLDNGAVVLKRVGYIFLLYNYIINTVHLVGEISWVHLPYFRCVQNHMSVTRYHEIKMGLTDISNKQVMM